MIKLSNSKSVHAISGITDVLFLNKDHIVSVRPTSRVEPGMSEIQVTTGVIYYVEDSVEDIIGKLALMV
jgi:hypothetical protein